MIFKIFEFLAILTIHFNKGTYTRTHTCIYISIIGTTEFSNFESLVISKCPFTLYVLQVCASEAKLLYLEGYMQA
jgi:hypothetical protein